MMQAGANSKSATLKGLDSTEQTLPTAGRSAPLGATVEQGGVNFSVYSRDAARIDLLLFDREDARPSRVIQLDPSANRTYHYWHVFVPGLQPGQLYGYRAHGPFDPSRGLRFDASKVLLDPYGREVVTPLDYSRDKAARAGYDSATTAMKSAVVDLHAYDWEGDVPLHRLSSQTVIYEMHVGGFTRHPASGLPPNIRGTFAGLIEKIPYLRDLGITAVELLPVFQFDAQDCPRGVVNYWGYQPVSFFAPHHAYSSRQDRLGPVN
jgi:isoamylase